MKTLLRLMLGAVLFVPAAARAAPPYQAPTQAAPMKSVQAPAPMQAPMKSVQAPSKHVQAPAQVPTQAPAKGTTAMTPNNSGYRTYSYQPSATPMYYNNGYQYGAGYGPAYRTGPAAQGFYRADHKIVGPY